MDEMDEFYDNIIELSGEDGESLRFEFLDLIEYEGEKYVVLFPVDEESNEVVILRLDSESEDDENDSYVTVEDEEVLYAVFNIFKEKFKDEFNFVD